MPITRHITLVAKVRTTVGTELDRIREYYTKNNRDFVIALIATVISTALGFVAGLTGPLLGFVVGLLLGIAGFIWLPNWKTRNREIEHIST